MNENIKQAVVRLAQWADEHPLVSQVFVFGSAVRGDTHAKSDLDVLVAFEDSVEAMVDRILIDETGWQAELRRLIEPISGLPVSVHGKPGDAAFSYVSEGESLFSYRKIVVVRTRPKAKARSSPH